jgi:hypothetical protein
VIVLSRETALGLLRCFPISRGSGHLHSALPRDLIQHTFNVGIHVAIGETDHADAIVPEPLCSRLIVFPLVGFVVRVSINLYGQIVLEAKEIEDEAINRMLAAELDAIEFLPRRNRQSLRS